MSCGRTRCPDAMTEESNSSGVPFTVGFMQVTGTEFTREELQKIRNQAQGLLNYSDPSDAEKAALVDLTNAADRLDAFAARDAADLALLTESLNTMEPPVTLTGSCPTCVRTAPRMVPRSYGKEQYAD